MLIFYLKKTKKGRGVGPRKKYCFQSPENDINCQQLRIIVLIFVGLEERGGGGRHLSIGF